MMVRFKQDNNCLCLTVIFWLLLLTGSSAIAGQFGHSVGSGSSLANVPNNLKLFQHRTPSGGGTLDSMVIWGGNRDGVNDTAVGAIYIGNGGAPGALIGVSSDSVVFSTGNLDRYVLHFPSGIPIIGDTLYWPGPYTLVGNPGGGGLTSIERFDTTGATLFYSTETLPLNNPFDAGCVGCGSAGSYPYIQRIEIYYTDSTVVPPETRVMQLGGAQGGG